MIVKRVAVLYCHQTICKGSICLGKPGPLTDNIDELCRSPSSKGVPDKAGSALRPRREGQGELSRRCPKRCRRLSPSQVVDGKYLNTKSRSSGENNEG